MKQVTTNVNERKKYQVGGKGGMHNFTPSKYYLTVFSLKPPYCSETYRSQNLLSLLSFIQNSLPIFQILRSAILCFLRRIL
jgi:hypothetical protein